MMRRRLLQPRLPIAPPSVMTWRCSDFSLGVTEQHNENGNGVEHGGKPALPRDAPAFLNNWGQQSNHNRLEGSDDSSLSIPIG